jgi:hypothetical protein
MATKASRIALAGSNISSTGEVDADLLDNIDSAAFLSLDSNGRLGIGTNLPNDVLHVDGASAFIRVNRTDGEAGITLMYNGSNTTRSNIATQTNGDLAIDTANAERMRITSSGNVGIGTQNPYGVTHWQKASTVNLVATNSGADGQADATVMSLIGQARGYSNNLAKLASIDFKTDPTTWYYGAMTFNVANLDGTDTSRTPLEAMRINRLGQVGIGTTSPSLPLTIVGDDGDPASSGATAVGALQIQQGTNDVVLEAGVKANSNRYAWLQSTNKVSHTAYNMALNPNGGNVGIGRTSPQSRLDVLSSARITSSANTSHAFKLESKWWQRWYWYNFARYFIRDKKRYC